MHMHDSPHNEKMKIVTACTYTYDSLLTRRSCMHALTYIHVHICYSPHNEKLHACPEKLFSRQCHSTSTKAPLRLHLFIGPCVSLLLIQETILHFANHLTSNVSKLALGFATSLASKAEDLGVRIKCLPGPNLVTFFCNT